MAQKFRAEAQANLCAAGLAVAQEQRAAEAAGALLHDVQAMVVAAVRVMRHGGPIEVELDGEPMSLWMIFIGNCRYRPDGFAPSMRPRLDDGQLDLRVIDAGHPWCRTRLVLGLVTGRLGRSPVYRQWAATALVVRSTDGGLRLAVDGETFDGGSEIEVLKSGDRVVLYSSGV